MSPIRRAIGIGVCVSCLGFWGLQKAYHRNGSNGTQPKEQPEVRALTEIQNPTDSQVMQGAMEEEATRLVQLAHAAKEPQRLAEAAEAERVYQMATEPGADLKQILEDGTISPEAKISVCIRLLNPLDDNARAQFIDKYLDLEFAPIDDRVLLCRSLFISRNLGSGANLAKYSKHLQTNKVILSYGSGACWACGEAGGLARR